MSCTKDSIELILPASRKLIVAADMATNSTEVSSSTVRRTGAESPPAGSIRATLSDAALPAMSIRPKPGLDGRGILVHMCGRCHNSRLDQALTRARFDVEALDTMSRDEKDLAIERLRLPDTDQHKMPPVRFHELSQEERELAISALAN